MPGNVEIARPLFVTLSVSNYDGYYNTESGGNSTVVQILDER